MPPLWLIGMMGAGKSTVGAEVAESRGVEHIDVDQRIVDRSGRSIADIFEGDGEDAFRKLEAEEIAIASSVPDAVISTGGGAVLDQANREIMHSSGAVVWLDVSEESIVERTLADGSRPLLADGVPGVGALLVERRPLYASASDYVVDADLSFDEVSARVGAIGAERVGSDSRILIGPGLPQKILTDSPAREQVVVLAHAGSAAIAETVADALRAEVETVSLLTVADREAAKSIDAVAEIYAQLAGLNVGRHDTMVGVGGGALTDVAGFVAATWLRGIESTLVPTTMLGAADAAIGGKTGINVGGKNLVGAFWHPTRVLISTDVLEQLPEALAREGAAEAIKAGFIADPAIVELYATHGLDAPVNQIIRRAVAVKARVVSEDFRESGVRAILNFGHTIGHGIETTLHIPHGHAVSIGMVAAAAISQQKFGFDARAVVDPLERLGLPTKAEGADADMVRSYISRDKKRTAAGLRMVLLRGMADPVVENVDNETVTRGLEAVGIG